MPRILDNVHAGFFLGGKDFVKDKIAKFKAEMESGDFAHKRKFQSTISFDDIISITANYFNVGDSAVGKADKKVADLLKEDKRL